MRPGEYVLTVEAEGYHPFEQRVTVTDADTQRLDIALAPLPGTVSVITTPVGADITLEAYLWGLHRSKISCWKPANTTLPHHCHASSHGRTRLRSWDAAKTRRCRSRWCLTGHT